MFPSSRKTALKKKINARGYVIEDQGKWRSEVDEDDAPLVDEDNAPLVVLRKTVCLHTKTTTSGERAASKVCCWI